ncbi:MAG: glucosidase [Calditrichae bacterium]|nr:glucosidase [Calditrichia bacterium]
MTKEQQRLSESVAGKKNWKFWGPYLSERQWGTVREDYSRDGDAWEFINYEESRSKAYRWGEDGIAGISDDQQRLCFALAMWNKRDPFIKERLFGLSGPQGNHGEDVKEYYYYLDSTPTHSYMKMLYKYPQSEFPYRDLLDRNTHRGLNDPEYELIDTGIFDENRYFDVFVEYAKTAPEDTLIQITVHNRGDADAPLHLLPTLWFRNTWAWGRDSRKPLLAKKGKSAIAADHHDLGNYFLFAENAPELLFCDNATNIQRLYNASNPAGFFKDGINDFLVWGDQSGVNPNQKGTKAAVFYKLIVPANGSQAVRLRLVNRDIAKPFDGFEKLFRQCQKDADEFYADLQKNIANDDAKRVQRQAFAGMLWTKQYYYYDISQWLQGDPGQPEPPKSRLKGRNREWIHLNNAEIISMPDKWEYPWYAAWDLAFHCIPLAMVDPQFAKNQLVLLTREWYMHPNGQLPAYEWAFGDVNPPVHAWATWRVYKMDQKRSGRSDTDFLERVFHKLLLNFTWWVNRKDEGDNNIFQGGFLGLDNIGVFNRSEELPTGGHLEQADGTAWMAMYSLNMMRIALELAAEKPIYQDLATKFFEHFLYIAEAMTNLGGKGINLWDADDAFFYDVLHTPNNQFFPLKVRSMVGLIPLFAVEVLEPDYIDKLPEFKKRLEWFFEDRKDLAELVSRWQSPGKGERRLLSLLRGHRMKRLLKRMLDETEFLSDYGIRSMSKIYENNPYHFRMNGSEISVKYLPAESDSYMFGGNSNWRGPIWFPVNFLIIEALQRFHHYYGDDFKVEYPTDSGNYLTILQIADAISERLTRIFLRDESGKRAVFGDHPTFQNDPHFRDYLLFYEYFHGDNGRGVGASHQTGWTGLIAKLLQPRDE